MKKRGLKILLSICLFTLLLECSMRLLGIYNTQSENILGRFTSGYGVSEDKLYCSWTPNRFIEYSSSEFSYSYMANSDGFREVEFPQNPVDSLDVIYILGDSFVEGDGAPYDSTLTRFLEKRFHKDGYAHVKVYNAGICGNDPVFSYSFLKHKLIYTKPALVLCLTGPSDIYDLHIRGGFERFTSNGGYKYKEKPLGLDLYHYSRISRIFFHWAGYEESLVPIISHDDSLGIIQQIVYSIQKSDSLCQKYGVNFSAIGYPHPGDIRYPGFKNYTDIISDNIDNKYYINIANPLGDSLILHPYSLYWPINLHFNSKGYEVMANVLYEQLLLEKPYLFNQLRR